MAEKLSKTSEDKPDYIRPLQPFQNIKSAPANVGDVALSLKDVQEIDKDTPAPPPRRAILVTEDELDAANPVNDRSEFVSYHFYRCTHPMCNAGKNKKPYRVFAGAGDFELDREGNILRGEERECACVPEPRKLKTYQNPRISVEQFEHGVMKLYEYRAPRAPMVKA